MFIMTAAKASNPTRKMKYNGVRRKNGGTQKAKAIKRTDWKTWKGETKTVMGARSVYIFGALRGYLTDLCRLHRLYSVEW
jgi:hypothetical protein